MARRAPAIRLLPLFVGAVLLMGSQPAEKKSGSRQETEPDYTEALREIEGRIVREIDRQGIVGLSIAVVDGDRLVWSRGYGWSDRERRVRATSGTVYRMGSISKLFTGTAVMQLAEQGAIDIDAPITEYLPGFELRERFEGDPPVTARNLMTHHSGMPSDLLCGAELTPAATTR